MEKLKIIIATHKLYNIPDDDIYFPIFVGSIGKKDILNYQRDDEGANISEKNNNYSELTGVYWAWKNLDADFIGVAHYRRHFARGNYWKKSIAHSEDFDGKLQVGTVIVPRKRKYYIETLYSHYSHSHYEQHLIETKRIIGILYPNYLNSYDKVMSQRSGYMFNMFIMSKEDLNDYCEWLFSILFELENCVDIRNYDSFQGRLFGRVSELLLNVWIEENQKKVCEIPWIYTERINKVNKVKSFLGAKLLKKKFKKSF